MPDLRILVGMSALALVSACGGGGSDAPDGAPPLDASQPDARVAEPDGAPLDAPVADATPAVPDATPAPDAPSPDASGPSCEVAPTCTGDLSGIGTGDFSVSFTVTTSAAGGSAVIAQRGACQHSNFWDLRTRTAGGFSLELDDSNVSYFSDAVLTPLNDGTPHAVSFCRKAGMLHVFVDGALELSAPAATSLAAGLAPLQTGTSPCVGFDGTAALVGTVTDVCLGAL